MCYMLFGLARLNSFLGRLFSWFDLVGLGPRSYVINFFKYGEVPEHFAIPRLYELPRSSSEWDYFWETKWIKLGSVKK